MALALCCCLIFPSYSYGQLSLPKVFGDNMVLQRDIAIPVWGKAAPGATVVAQLGAAHASAQADGEGKWILRFPKLKAGGPYELTVSEKGKTATSVKFSGILIGDVWLASGQSNMEWQVQQAKDAQKEIANANHPQIRFIIVKQDKQLSPQSDISSGSWKVCDASSVKELSAVAYYFSRKIQQDQQVPIGIIQSTWGGTPAEAWTSKEKLAKWPVMKDKMAAVDTLTPNDFVQDSLNNIRFWEMVNQPQANADKILTQPAYADADWDKLNAPGQFKHESGDGIIWLRKKITLPASFAGKPLKVNAGHPEMTYSLYINGKEICKNVWNAAPVHTFDIPAGVVQAGENNISIRLAVLWGSGGLNGPAEDLYITDGTTKVSLAGTWLFKRGAEPAMAVIRNFQYSPTLLFNAMIHPLIPYAIKGAIWYQGESNTYMAYDYRTLFPMLIADWRERWQQGNFPFLFVQLANFQKRKEEPSESDWAELREAQTFTLSQPNTGMACTIDIGDGNNIHPANKQEVGRRLALLADKQVYKQNVVAAGPLYKGFKKTGNTITIDFDNATTGLITQDGKAVTGFAIAGKDGHFHWAQATIKGRQVVVQSAEVPDPVAVRYAWADNPACNLANAEGLPAVPFRTDQWKGITQH
ncbi:sialate O-acetylesterase [Chitinophaga jiangningensis]|uniref:Sialate O-acetylesterase n=2 Tax=Chitinophaga jiangningensis TaxID=1419482 RepID=A0A1M7J8Z9_9BACT|nr:sialate O-acetylesterase [Chitinophaga jiangningensis]